MNVQRVSYLDKNAAEGFTRSLHETGFGVLSDHPISMSLIHSVYEDWRKFFESNRKHEFLYDKKTQDGYFPFQSEHAKQTRIGDLKEFFHIHTNAPIPPFLGPQTRELFDQLLELGRKLLVWLDQSAPESIRSHFSMPLDQMISRSPQHLFRIIHYPPLVEPIPEGAIRAAAHEDINLITLLPASTATGLQVRDSAGRWHDVPGGIGDIVVNVGDMLQEASQGYFKSTTHQVINPQGQEARKPRYSMPLFVHPTPSVPLSKTRTAQQYLDERLREIGLS